MSKQPSPDDVFHAVHVRTGGQLFTVTVLDRAAGLARRVYTSHPETYPVSGTKPMSQGAWTTQVIEQGKLFVANSVAEFAIYFSDHAVIESLGCGSALNIPILESQVIGTVNILDQAGHFTPQRVAHCQEAVAQSHEDLVLELSSWELHHDT